MKYTYYTDYTHHEVSHQPPIYKQMKYTTHSHQLADQNPKLNLLPEPELFTGETCPYESHNGGRYLKKNKSHSRDFI